MWSGGAREQANSDRKLPLTQVPTLNWLGVVQSVCVLNLLMLPGVGFGFTCWSCWCHVGPLNVTIGPLSVTYDIPIGLLPRWTHSISVWKSLIVWMCCCSTHAGSGLCRCVVEYRGHRLIVAWTSGGPPIVSQNILENGHPWATVWCCCGCVMAPPFQTSNSMHTSGFSCHTKHIWVITAFEIHCYILPHWHSLWI